jgi:hypothetical protein
VAAPRDEAPRRGPAPGIDLHGIAWRLEPGHVLELEVTTGSTQYAAPRTGPFAVSLTATVDLAVSPG